MRHWPAPLRLLGVNSAWPTASGTRPSRGSLGAGARTTVVSGSGIDRGQPVARHSRKVRDLKAGLLLR
eukprot:5854854-Prorocentrum_lima.AAC.1